MESNNLSNAHRYLDAAVAPGGRNAHEIKTYMSACLMYILLEALTLLGRIATAKERLASAAERELRRIP